MCTHLRLNAMCVPIFVDRMSEIAIADTEKKSSHTSNPASICSPVDRCSTVS